MALLVCVILCLLQAPYRWRHALLTPVRDYLKNEWEHGRYSPLLSKGLADDYI